MKNTGVVVHSEYVAEDCNYRTQVRLDRSGNVVEVRFPHRIQKGKAVSLLRV